MEKTTEELLKDMENLEGELPFSLTNDFFFKYLLQTDNNSLKALVASYLSLSIDDIRKIEVTNPISPGDDSESKEMILDIKAVMNDNTIINLEMQIINHHNWQERSVSYLCRSFDSLKKGENYLNVKGVIQIGFLDYTLFPDVPEFYSTNMLMNVKTHKIYSSLLRLSVVDLTKIELATEEDRAYHRDIWAAFFKSKTWRELMVLANENEQIAESVVTIRKLSDDEKFKMRCEAREDYIRNMNDFHMYYAQQIAKRDEQLAEQKEQLSEKDGQLAEKDGQLAEKDRQLAEQRKQIEELMTKLKEK